MTGQTDGQWTDWTPLDGLGPLLAIGTAQSYDERSDTLVHLQELGLMRFGHDELGALYLPDASGPRRAGPGAARRPRVCVSQRGARVRSGGIGPCPRRSREEHQSCA
jgi:hypothetical protein